MASSDGISATFYAHFLYEFAYGRSSQGPRSTHMAITNISVEKCLLAVFCVAIAAASTTSYVRDQERANRMFRASKLWQLINCLSFLFLLARSFDKPPPPPLCLSHTHIHFPEPPEPIDEEDFAQKSFFSICDEVLRIFVTAPSANAADCCYCCVVRLTGRLRFIAVANGTTGKGATSL